MGLLDFLKKKDQPVSAASLDTPPSPASFPSFDSSFSQSKDSQNMNFPSVPGSGADFKLDIPGFSEPAREPMQNWNLEPRQTKPSVAVQEQKDEPEDDFKINVPLPVMVTEDEMRPVEQRIEEHVEEAKAPEQGDFSLSQLEEEKPRIIETSVKRNVERPIYLNLDQCEEMIGDLIATKASLKRLEDSAYGLNEVRTQSDKATEGLKRSIEAVHHGLIKIDRVIFKGEQ